MIERHRCRACDCCYADIYEEPYVCAGCFLSRGHGDCDKCSKHTLLYEPGRDGHREKDIILSAKEAPFQEIAEGVRIEPEETPRGWEEIAKAARLVNIEI